MFVRENAEGKGQHESSARSLKLTRSLSLPLVLLV